MRAAFWVEKDAGTSGPCLMGADSLPSPPADDRRMYVPGLGGTHAGGGGAAAAAGVGVSAWAEIWDYVGGTSYRAFVGEQNGEKTLFAFFDSTVVDMELKQA
ncbi:hypothetical protein IMZ48_22505 [Candidatus Bathyarchaeota archaeon]|nr:hypothetical protein [Candidatus Bathyarchaeota archaeon]